MCGIIGRIDYSGKMSDPESIIAARDLLLRRGPDDAGLWISEGAALGHRRLSILDLTDAGHQPMVSADGRYVIVFNGEVYNFDEIRRSLDPTGLQWRSRSDTEVVLAAYARWGEQCLERFRGMFALAIWDIHEKRLFAARDRMGVKPFYYWLAGGVFGFASRPRALTRLFPDEPREFDAQALRLYLESGYIPAPFAALDGMRKLPPAHYLIFDRNGLRIARYWDFRQIEPEASWSNRSEADLLDELDEIMAESVRLRLVSDVPLGAFLSGGIDSTLVTAMMARQSPGRIKTFTIGFREKPFDESVHAETVAAHLGTEHHCEVLQVADLLKLLPEFLREYDEPFFDHSAFPTMAVSHMARRHVTVSLSGDGGDELFGGYHYYRIAQHLAPLFRAPHLVRRVLAAPLAMMPSHRLKLLAGAMRQPDQAAAYAFSRSIAKDFRNVVTPELTEGTRSLHDLFSETARAFPRGLDAASCGMRLDAMHVLSDDYLQKVDVASMAASLESREPLLDHVLVEWAMRLPVSWKLRAGRNKYLLRKLAYRYVPPSILDRPKQGFGVPMDEWLRGPLKDWARERIEERRSYERLPLNQRGVLALFEMHQRGFRNVASLLWAILVLLENSTTATA